MAKTAQNIIDQAEILLHDTSNDRYSEAELLYYLNEGQREIVSIDGTANSVTSAYQLSTGVKQTAPSDSIELLDVNRNLGRAWVTATEYAVDDAVYNSSTRYVCLVAHTAGTFAADLSSAYWSASDLSSGPVIEQIHKANMNVMLGNGWVSDDASTDIDIEPTVDFWIPEPLDSNTFFVYPPQPTVGTEYIELIYAQLPTDILITAEITLGDRYAGILLDYIIYRANSKDIDTPEGLAIARAEYNKFLNHPIFRRHRR